MECGNITIFGKISPHVHLFLVSTRRYITLISYTTSSLYPLLTTVYPPPWITLQRTVLPHSECMPGTLSRSLRNRRSRSNTDTPSTITSTSTTRESTPEIDSKPTPTPSAYSLLTQLRLRRRPRPLPTRRSPPMFSSPKYTPLPTSSGPQRKRAGGGLVAWKRWALLGTVILVLLVLGYSRVGGGDGEAWEAESESLI